MCVSAATSAAAAHAERGSPNAAACNPADATTRQSA